MQRDQLDHILRAAAGVTNDSEFVVVGSQAILGITGDVPAALLTSVEVDVYPRRQPERSILIDGAIGEGSIFHDTFGYYAHGVGEETAIAPDGWSNRLTRYDNPNTNGAVGWCMEPHDLVVAKLVAGRDKDIEFARVALDSQLVDGLILLERAATVSGEQSLRDRVAGVILQFMSSTDQGVT